MAQSPEKKNLSVGGTEASTESSKGSFTDFFIHHPVFSWVINIVIVLLGVTAFFQLSTRQYPKTENPVITVTAEINGSTQTLESQIATPLEEAFASLQGLESMDTEINPGESVTKLTFSGRAMDSVFNEVQYLVKRAEDKLPDGVKTKIARGNVDAPPVMEIVAFGDEKTNLSDLHDLAENTLKSTMEAIPGVVMAEVMGGGEFQMDVILDPLKMSGYHVTSHDVVNALKRHNLQRSVGKITDQEREFTLVANATLRTPKEFSDIVILKQDEHLIRLSDIANIQVRSAEEQEHVLYDGHPTIALNIRPGPEANPIEISKNVREQLEKIRPSLAHGVKVEVVTDKSIYIKHAINQVYSAIFEAIVLVLLVIFFFLRSTAASVIPLITIPISLIGTFFIMYILGFTINILSLLAFVLAIGLVVDDAIVVLENIYRYIERGVSPFKAAIEGTREIRFSIVAMTITLAAVYAPLAMVPGDIGKVFKEFALTLAGAVVISGIVALTLSPLMCAGLLRSHTSTSPSVHALSGPKSLWSTLKTLLERVSNVIERGLLALDRGYVSSIKWVLNFKALFLVATVCFALLSIFLAKYHLKKEMAPRADEGILVMRMYPAASKNLAYLIRHSAQIDSIIKSQPELSNYILTLRVQPSSFGKSTLIPWDKRRPCADIALDLRKKLDVLTGIESSVGCAQSSIIQKSGDAQDLEIRILTNNSASELKKVGKHMRKLLKQYPAVGHMEITESMQAPGYNVIVDREKSNRLGIDPEDVASTFGVLVGGQVVGKFEKNNRLFPVHVWVGEKFRRSVEDLSFLFVKGHRKTSQGRSEEIMVPVKEMVNFVAIQGEATINRYMKKRCFDLQATLKPGYAPEELYTTFQNQALKELPPGYLMEPAGELARFFKESNTMYAIFGLSMLFIFLVMAAQFESFLSPFIILFSVPMALGGAVLTLAIIPQGTLNVYSQIGLITLIGLISKHGILLVDFANQALTRGQSLYDSIIEACQLRLRPILMTSFAMILGALPLALATGAGSEARRQIGWVIVGGMTIGTLFTLFVVPLVYMLFARPKRLPKT